jgi:phospholipid/cholesterol/gamma-HCH transport system substrate-binding protein
MTPEESPSHTSQTPHTPQAPVQAPVPPPIKHVEFKALLLLAFTALLVCGFLVYVMVARGVFESTQQLVLVADDSEGVQVGMDMTFSGFPIGRVRRIELDEAGKARIVIDVPAKDAHWLRSSSIFTMERGVVGETRIRAFSGVLTDPPLPVDAVRSVLRGDTSAEIPRVVAAMRALLENLATMSGSDSSLNASLGNMQTITATLSSNLGGRYGVLGTFLGGDANAKKVVAALDRTNSLLAKAEERVFGARGVMDETQATIVQLNALLGDARTSLKKMDAVLAEAQGLASEAKGVAGNVRTATTDLGVLRSEVDASLRKIGSLVDEINRKWPFARDAELKLP